VARAADAVLLALENAEKDALRRLARARVPDPWLVAEELRGRGASDAARALAREARPEVGKPLAAWLEAAGGARPPATPVVAAARDKSVTPKVVGSKRFRRDIVLYVGRDVIPFAARIHAVPLNALWAR